MAKRGTRNFHVPLPPVMYDSLRAAAEREGVPATELAREAISEYLVIAERRHRHELIADYAAEFSGTEADLDEALEAAAAEVLFSDLEDEE